MPFVKGKFMSKHISPSHESWTWVAVLITQTIECKTTAEAILVHESHALRSHLAVNQFSDLIWPLLLYQRKKYIYIQLHFSNSFISQKWHVNMLNKKDITVKTFLVTSRHKERCGKMAESVLLMTTVTWDWSGLLKTWLVEVTRAGFCESKYITVCFASKPELQGCCWTCRCGCSSCPGTAWAAGSPVSDCSICGQISGRLWTHRSAFVGASWVSQSASCTHGAPSESHQSVWIKWWPLRCRPRPFLAGCHSPHSSPPSDSALRPPDWDLDPAGPPPPQRIPAVMSHTGHCAAQRAPHPDPPPGSALQTAAVHCLSSSRARSAPAPLLFSWTEHLPQTAQDGAIASQHVCTPPMWVKGRRDPHTPTNTPAEGEKKESCVKVVRTRIRLTDLFI